MANRKQGVKGVGVREFRKMGDKRAHVAHRSRQPMNILGHLVKKYETTAKTDPNRGRLRDIMNAAVLAGITPKMIKHQTGITHTQMDLAANGNPPGLSKPQRHALLHFLKEKVEKDKAARSFPGQHFHR